MSSSEAWWKQPTFKFGCELVTADESARDGALVGVIMGSRSDWPYVAPCCRMLEELQVDFEYGVVSAHRTPNRMALYAQAALGRGIKIIIACAGGSAHLPGMVASETLIPVIGIAPKKSDASAVGSMIEMPEGIPLAYLGGGSEPGRSAGAVNAALFAARMLSVNDEALLARLRLYQEKLSSSVPITCFD